ncbi:hypothetical protein ACWDSJ_10035 [Nocardia sp. NPDC003482]
MDAVERVVQRVVFGVRWVPGEGAFIAYNHSFPELTCRGESPREAIQGLKGRVRARVARELGVA